MKDLCEVCLNTDFATALDPTKWECEKGSFWYIKVAHQPSLAALRTSALQDCPLCIFIANNYDVELNPKEPEPRHRFEEREAKQRRKKARRKRLEEQNSGQCYFSPLPAYYLHEDWSPCGGDLAGYGLRYQCERRSAIEILVTPIEGSTDPVATRNLTHTSDIDVCREWLTQCRFGHQRCPQNFDTSLPTRLIDLGDPDAELAPRLALTSGMRGQYATLSHRWGEEPPKTTKANVNNRLHSMALDEMPNTFRDALEIVRALKLRYCWIDSYCIVQDDDADWQRECASMADIFANSAFTLAAPDAIDCNTGFPRGVHPLPVDTWCDIPVRWNGPAGNGTVRLSSPMPRPTIREFGFSSSPLARRAWVFQERMLSPRLLYFGTDRLQFECHTMQCVEHVRFPLRPQVIRLDHGMQLPPHFVYSFNNYGQGLANWYFLLHTYSTLYLTREDDRLPALSGIASRFAERLGDEYVAGMWKRGIVWGLNFAVVNPKDKIRSRHPASLSGPSWSWYSCDKPVGFNYDMETRCEVEWSGDIGCLNLFDKADCFGALIKVVSVSATPLGRNIFGQVRDARLSVFGKLQSVTCHNGNIHCAHLSEPVGRIRLDYGDIRGEQSVSVTMLPISIQGDWNGSKPRDRMWYALALQPVPNEPATYRRVGVIPSVSAGGEHGVSESMKLTVAEWLLSGEESEVHLV